MISTLHSCSIWHLMIRCPTLGWFRTLHGVCGDFYLKCVFPILSYWDKHASAVDEIRGGGSSTYWPLVPIWCSSFQKPWQSRRHRRDVKQLLTRGAVWVAGGAVLSGSTYWESWPGETFYRMNLFCQVERIECLYSFWLKFHFCCREMIVWGNKHLREQR